MIAPIRNKILNYIQEKETVKLLEKVPNKDCFKYLFTKNLDNFSEYVATNLRPIFEIGKEGESRMKQNKFCIFQKYDDNEYLCVWVTYNGDMEIYNLLQETKIKKITSIHQGKIVNSIKHFKDIQNKRDLIFTTSKDYYVKVWDVTNWSIQLQIYNPCNNDPYILAPLFYIDKNLNEYMAIIGYLSGKINLFDLKGGNRIGDGVSLKSSKILLFELYQDNTGNYIISGDSETICSLKIDGEVITTYQVYNSEPKDEHHCGLVHKNKLIEASTGFIRIWDFHSAELLKTFDYPVYSNKDAYKFTSLIMWNEDLLIAGALNHPLMLINANNGEIEKVYKNMWAVSIYCMKNIEHPIYGPSIIVYFDGTIYLWSYLLKIT